MSLAIFGLALLVHAATPPATPEEARRAAKQATAAGQSDEAARVLEDARTRFPEDASVYSALGRVYIDLKRFDDAAQAYAMSLELQRDQNGLRYYRAYALREAGRLDEAAGVYEVFLKQEPDDADGWYGLAETQERRQNLLGAAEAYEAYAKAEKRPAQAKWVQAAKDKAAELRAQAASAAPTAEATPVAEAAPAAAAETAPTETAPAETSVAAAEAAPEPPVTVTRPSAGLKATQSTKKSTKKVGAKRGPAFDAAVSALKAERFEDAERALGAPPAADSSDYAVLGLWGSIYLGEEKLDEAIALYQRAVEAAPEPAAPALLLGLAEAYRFAGNPGGARDALDRALGGSLGATQLDPGLAALLRERRAALD